MALVLDWLQAEQPADLVRQAVDSLRAGGLVSLPTEAGYVLAASAADPSSIQRLRQAAPNSEPLTYALPDDLDAVTIFPSTDPVANRLARRCWPGPLTIALSQSELGAISPYLPVELRQSIADDGFLGFWCPASTPAQAVLLAADFPIVFRELPVNPADPVSQLPEGPNAGQVAVVIHAGTPKPGPTTRVLVEQRHWRVLREGVVEHETLVRAAARWIVFVCTGNTCRSPMAEALLKHRLAQRLGCEVTQLSEKGYNILSAGVAASPDDGAALEAVEALRTWGADLTRHRSQMLTEVLLRQADHLIAMTRNHLMVVLGRYPATSAALSLLCGYEGDLDDPIGAGPDVYEACARTIVRHVDRLIMEFIVR